MKFWFDEILVDKWLPAGESGPWSVRKTVIPGSRLKWLADGGDEYGRYLPPGTYTGLFYQNPDTGREQRVMFDEPREIKEALRFVERARGRVLVTGLGLGMIATWLARQPNVTSVDVIEKSQDVIDIVAPHLPSKKIRVIKADAFDYASPGYDCVWHDCFLEVPERMDDLTRCYPSPHIDFWQPNVLTEPVPRRRFLRNAAIAAFSALLFLRSTLSVPAAMPFAGITLVQQNSSSASATNVLGADVTAGNSVIACINVTGGTCTAVTGGGVTFVADKSQIRTQEVSVWRGHLSSGAAANKTITITPAGRTTAVYSNVSEWSGLANSAPEATNSNFNVSTANPATGSVTNTTAASLIIATCGWDISQTYSSGPTNSFTRMLTGTFRNESAYQIVAASASRSTDWTLGGLDEWAAVIVSYAGTFTGPTPAQRSAGFFDNFG